MTVTGQPASPAPTGTSSPTVEPETTQPPAVAARKGPHPELTAHVGRVWRSVVLTPGRLRGRQRDVNSSRPLGRRVGLNLAGVGLFGWVFLFIPILLVCAVELVVVGYAAVVTVVWAVLMLGAGVRGLVGRRRA